MSHTRADRETLICIVDRNRVGQSNPCLRPADQECSRCRRPHRHGLMWNTSKARWERIHPVERYDEAAARIINETLEEDKP